MIQKDILERLSKSKFRSSFRLNERDHSYLLKIGLEVARQHTTEFIQKRLASAIVSNDGEQTPTKGHPVFVAQHATAACCCDCLFKWHQIPRNSALTRDEVSYIADVIIHWLQIQLVSGVKPKASRDSKSKSQLSLF